jgi:hypothetical protein
VFVLFALFCKFACRNYREKIDEKLKGLKTKFIWNGIIRFISIGYLNFCISASSKIQDMLRFPETVTPFGILSTMIIVGLLVTYCLMSLIWLFTNIENLENPETIAKFGLWYDGIQYHKSKWALLYYPMFIIRRFIFMFWPVILMGHPC